MPSGDVDEQALAATAAQLTEQTPGEVIGAVCDVADEEAVYAFVADATQRLGWLHVVVNNAGIGGRRAWSKTCR